MSGTVDPKSKRQNPKIVYTLSNSDYSSIVKEVEKKYATDLRQRLLTYAVDTLKLLMSLPKKRELDVIRYQLSKSATSIGANYEEAQSSS